MLRGVANPMSGRKRRKRREKPKPDGVVKTTFKVRFRTNSSPDITLTLA